MRHPCARTQDRTHSDGFEHGRAQAAAGPTGQDHRATTPRAHGGPASATCPAASYGSRYHGSGADARLLPKLPPSWQTTTVTRRQASPTTTALPQVLPSRLGSGLEMVQPRRERPVEHPLHACYVGLDGSTGKRLGGFYVSAGRGLGERPAAARISSISVTRPSVWSTGLPTALRCETCRTPVRPSLPP
jgi:hypothetical protein